MIKGKDDYVYSSKLTGEKTAKYFVVIGFSANKNNAKGKINALAKENINAFIMTEVNSEIIRICVAEGDTFDEILNSLNTVRKNTDPDAWIIRNE